MKNTVRLSFIAFAAILAFAAGNRVSAVTVVKDIVYDASLGAYGLGDLYLPETADAESLPVVLCIHGGGWSGGDRASWAGVAKFFSEELGFAAFNIEYRLAGASARWPACGNDCVAAANFLLSEGFKQEYGLAYTKIWICGGSAGGHLALWTLVNIPADKVAGCVSISAIGRPEDDCAVHPSRYSTLFGAAPSEEQFRSMDPCDRIASGMAPLLCTHADVDTEAPVSSHRAFAKAYAAAGNDCRFFEYPWNVHPNLPGHRIWVNGSDPHKLIPEIEHSIRDFTCRIRFGRKNAQ